jgi:hypothetical protein|tara:strand:+ start:1246 stop:1425 length:180 start_codon:yes stop_codon:yes gene_type:complete
MKNYNLEQIHPLLRECKDFFDRLALSYKIEGAGVPDKLKNVREKVNKQIKQIEGEVKWK